MMGTIKLNVIYLRVHYTINQKITLMQPCNFAGVLGSNQHCSLPSFEGLRCKIFMLKDSLTNAFLYVLREFLKFQTTFTNEFTRRCIFYLNFQVSDSS